MDEEDESIKTLEEYIVLFDELEKLVMSSPRKGSPEFERIKVLDSLLDEFEKRVIPLDSEPSRTGGRY